MNIKIVKVILKWITIGFVPISGLIIDKILKDKSKKENIALKVIKRMIIIPLSFLLFLSFITIFIEDDTIKETKKVSYTLVTQEQYENIKLEIKGHETNLPTGNITVNNDDGSQSVYIPMNPGNFIQEWVDFSKLTPNDLSQLKQYVEIIESAASKYNIPAWVLYSFNANEYGLKTLGESKIKIGSSAFDKAGLKFGSTHKSTGKVVDYYNYGKQEATVDGVTENDKYRGPFQLDKDKKLDHYNFAQSADWAVDHMNTLYGYLGKSYKNTEMSDNLKYMMAMTSYNTGPAGFMARVPKDAISTYISVMDRAMNEGHIREYGSVFTQYGHSPKAKASGWMIADILGFNISESAAGLVNSHYKNYKIQNNILPNKSHGTSWPGNISGNRKSGYTDYFYKVTSSDRGQKHGWTAYKIGTYNIGMIFSYEDFGYMLGTFGVGNYIRDTAMKALQQSSSSESIESGVIYHWEEEQTLEDGEIVSTRTIVNPTGYEITGEFGEVGYKGNYPLFVQSTLLDETSKLSWKFNGTDTTLGESGCSLFAMTSLIHGAGYGDKPIPNAEILNSSGLNENNYISVANLSEILTNGPLLADSANKLGYTTKEIPTTDEGLEEIYQYLKEGIPFVVNTRYGDITGYDEVYRPHTVHFTNTGHFILLVGAFELQGTRYIEVVQSTYSNAGTADKDQNVLVYDFDELKEKGIFRSSGGYRVPAYTITGTYDGAYGTPDYMKTNYKPPIRTENYLPSKTLVNDSKQSFISIDDLIMQIKDDGFIELPTEMRIEINRRRDTLLLYINDSTALEVNGVDFDRGNIVSGTYPKGTYVGKILSTSTFSRVYGNGKDKDNLLVIK